MYKNILVPTTLDHERDTKGAIAVARQLADENADITLLHVIEQIPPYVASQVPVELMMQNRAEKAADLKELAADVPGATTELIDGHSGRSILEWAEQHGPDCIVIAGHRPGMRDLLLGSTATQVVRHAACAVHVLR